MKKTADNTQIITGNYATALAAKLSRVRVVAAYPITPQSPATEALSQFVEKGELDAEYVRVESEHSAMSVCIAASTVGARTFTATSANGLAYMCEQLHWAAGARLPIVLACVNRAMSAPWSVLNDQQDSISQRDAGWVQIYARNSQEILDSIIQAYRIAEKVYVPVMVCYDGYILSHTVMPVEVPNQEQVDRFLPPYKPHTVLDPSAPQNLNLVTLANPRRDARGVMCHGYMELRYLLQEALENTLETVVEVDREFGDVFGRSYGGTHWGYRLEDATLVLMAMGSVATEATVAVDQLRQRGHRAGLLALRVYRPFPKQDVISSTKEAELIIVFDKNISYGYEGATCSDLKAALYGNSIQVPVHNYIIGLGGRDVKARELADAAEGSLRWAEEGRPQKAVEWLNCHI
ncbi:MAG: transketolase C-terminal domain-containing protein [Dehalococcoidia bacterium]